MATGLHRSNPTNVCTTQPVRPLPFHRCRLCSKHDREGKMPLSGRSNGVMRAIQSGREATTPSLISLIVKDTCLVCKEAVLHKDFCVATAREATTARQQRDTPVKTAEKNTLQRCFLFIIL